MELEKTVEILCDAKENYLIYDEKGNPHATDMKGVIDVICLYSTPVKIRLKAHNMRPNETNKYVLEKIAEMHNRLYHAKIAVDDAMKKLAASE